MENKFQGTGVALVTPFDQNGNVDFEGFLNVINHVSEWVDYLVVCGTTGESATLNSEEKHQTLDFVLNNNVKQLPVVFGVGGNNTLEVNKSLSNVPEGVDAILSVSPAYNKPSQKGIVEHFKAVADACKYSIILYNVPGRTSSNLLWQTTLELADHPNIIGIKEASGDLIQCMHILSKKPDNFQLISGDDMLTPSLLPIGASGVISVLANAFPYHFAQLCKYNNKELFFELLDINPLMYEEGNPVGIKEVLRLMSICENHVRLPLLKASEGLSSRIRHLLTSISDNR